MTNNLTRKNLRLQNFDYANKTAIYFITICTWKERPYFTNYDAAKFIYNEIVFRSKTVEQIRLFAYCIMPTHVHLLLLLGKEYRTSLANWVAAFKKYNSREINYLFGVKPLWQRNFYDHIVRKEESLIKIAEYIADNPVRAGLAVSRDDYEFCEIFYDEIRSVLGNGPYKF